ncbi:hypothetical protein [Mycolicibacterium celeriflavum]|uniref:hypothetical protein n=1 Tax=Mycolicibacterium celeriflavum TaxID=1249101 RepID=UPI003CED52C5
MTEIERYAAVLGVGDYLRGRDRTRVFGTGFWHSYEGIPSCDPRPTNDFRPDFDTQFAPRVWPYTLGGDVKLVNVLAKLRRSVEELDFG